MRRHFIVSGILLILPIIDFAVAAPVLIREKRQADTDVAHISENSMVILGKRGYDMNNLFLIYEDHFATPESSAARPSSSSPPSGPDHGQMDVEKTPPSHPEGWSPVSSPEHAPPNPGPFTEFGYESMEGDAPGTQVFPTWFHPIYADHGLMGHASLPKLGPSNPKPSAESDSGHRLPMEEPPSGPALPTKSDADQENQVVHPPPPPVSPSSTEFDDGMYESDRRSIGVDSRLGNLQAASDASKGNDLSSTARNVLHAAQRGVAAREVA